MRWILNGPALSTLAGDPVAQRFFADSRPFVLQKSGDPVGLPPSWQAQPIRSFTSVATLKQALATGAVGPEVRGILYDSERWRFTPVEEQRNHAAATLEAAGAVHAAGLLFITAPAVNLTRALAPEADSEKRYELYLRLNIAADAARYADAIDIQAQGSEKRVPMFANFVRRAAAQAREANPKVIVLAGISTNPNGQSVSAGEIVRAIDATRGFVDGYWFNIPRRSEYCPNCNDFRPDLAIEVLRCLGSPSSLPSGTSKEPVERVGRA